MINESFYDQFLNLFKFLVTCFCKFCWKSNFKKFCNLKKHCILLLILHFQKFSLTPVFAFFYIFGVMFLQNLLKIKFQKIFQFEKTLHFAFDFVFFNFFADASFCMFLFFWCHVFLHFFSEGLLLKKCVSFFAKVFSEHVFQHFRFCSQQWICCFYLNFYFLFCSWWSFVQRWYHSDCYKINVLNVQDWMWMHRKIKK